MALMPGLWCWPRILPIGMAVSETWKQVTALPGGRPCARHGLPQSQASLISQVALTVQWHYCPRALNEAQRWRKQLPFSRRLSGGAGF